MRRYSPLYPGHTAAYEPLGVVNGTLYLLTDRDAPNKKVVAVPIERARSVELEDDRRRNEERPSSRRAWWRASSR